MGTMLSGSINITSLEKRARFPWEPGCHCHPLLSRQPGDSSYRGTRGFASPPAGGVAFSLIALWVVKLLQNVSQAV